MIAALFVCRDSVYKGLSGVDCWDIDRDARGYRGGSRVVAHPPCRAWASLRHCAKPRVDEKDLAFFAIEAVRRCGGVLEHPVLSTFWAAAGVPLCGVDAFGGWSFVVDQFWFGHRARKRTRLYVVGRDFGDFPRMPLVIGESPCTVGLWSGRDRERCRPSIKKREYEATPIEFAKYLVDLAGGK